MQQQPPPSSSFNPEQFKQAQRQGWDRTANGWKTWWPEYEHAGQKVSDRLVELAEVRSGSKVLDVATGIGEPAVTAPRRVQPNGKVLATDISSEMLQIAKERVEKYGLQSIVELREGDAESLNLPDRSFDAVLCRMGLMFFPSLQQALSLFHNALVPSGKIAAAIWPLPDRVPFLNVAFRTVRNELNLPPPPLDQPPFNLSSPSVLQDAFTKAEFDDVRTENMRITITFDSPDRFTDFHKAISAPLHQLLANQSADKQNEVWQAVREAARPYTNSQGQVETDNEVICCVGSRKDSDLSLKR